MGEYQNKGRKALEGRVWRLSGLALGAGAALCAGAANAQTAVADDSSSSEADSTLTFPEMFNEQVVKGSEVHGRVGFYDFRRWHDTNQPYPGQPATKDDFNTESTNFGAQIGIQTGRIYGFSAGAEFVYEGALYGNNDAGTRLNCNLACGKSVENLTQGYLQFNAYGTQIRAGRQLLNTPLAAADQFTFLPRSFQGVSGVIRPLETYRRLSYNPTDLAEGDATSPNEYGPQITRSRIADNTNYETDQYLPFSLGAKNMDIPEWQIFAAKVTRYEGRGNDDSFSTNNRYFNDTAGFWSAGTSFRNITDAGQVIGQYYHYRFQQTESADYGEIGYMAPMIGEAGNGGWAPYIRAQAVAAYDADESRIPQGINSQVYGLKIGVDTAEFGFSIYGNYSPTHDGSFNHGQMLHPYTDISGVNYTDTMNNGIDEFGPGWAAGARVDFTPTDNLAMYARYVKYKAEYGHYHDFYFNGGEAQLINDDTFTGEEVQNQYSDAIGIGLTYDMGGIWKQLAGLKINDNLGITRYDQNAPNFYDNRVRFYYEF